MIKLTGQSCKSKLFLEALKQYVPGKLIQAARKDADGTELKMCCLEGALSYFRNCRLGYMKVAQEYQVGALPYEIMAYTHENKEKILVESLDPEDHIGCISRFMIGRQLDLYLNDGQGRRLRTCYFTYDTAKIEAFYMPAGTAVELYATTLHYAPCTAKGDGFRCAIVLPAGTNLELDFEPSAEGEDRLITAKNKWLIAHEEAQIAGAFCGLKGENITLV